MSTRLADQPGSTLADMLLKRPQTRVINVTAQLAQEESEAMLALYQTYPYAELFALPSERQRLLRYVMNRVHRIYLVTERVPVQLNRSAIALTQRLEIRRAVREGMEAIAGAYFKADRRGHSPAIAPRSSLSTPCRLT